MIVVKWVERSNCFLSNGCGLMMVEVMRTNTLMKKVIMKVFDVNIYVYMIYIVG